MFKLMDNKIITILRLVFLGGLSRDLWECITLLNGPQQEKTCLQGLANNKGTDQPAHPGRLTSAFVVFSF